MAEIAKIEVETLEAKGAVQAAAADAKAESEAAAEAGLAASLRPRSRRWPSCSRPSATAACRGADRIKVEAGFEERWPRRWANDLDAPVAADAPAHRRERRRRSRPGAAGRASSRSSPVSKAGPSVTRRLRQIGVVAAADGARLPAHPAVRPAPGLPEGHLWRWGTASLRGRGRGGCHAACRAQSARHACPREGEARQAAEERTRGREAAAQRLAAAQAEEKRLRAALARGADQGGADPRGADRHGAPGAGDGGQDSRRRRCQGPRPRRARRGARPPLGNRGGASALGGTQPWRRTWRPRRTAAADLRSRVTESRTELITLEREHRARTERQAAIGLERERWQTRSPAPISRSPRSRNGPPRPRPRSPSLRPCPP